jgi:hypothetical protein
MYNNLTQEYWAWHRDDYAYLMTSPRFDFQHRYLAFFGYFVCNKFLRLFGAIFSFMTVSFVNGMAIRVAIMTSNVAIFPLMWVLKAIMG